MPLVGGHALVTGGGTGVGAAIALALAEAGAEVTITGRRAAPLAETAARHARLHPAPADATDPAAVSEMVAAAAAARGPVAIAVANAGVSASAPFRRLALDDLDRMLDVNLKGTVTLWQAVLPAMVEAGAGRLIAVASTAGLRGYPYVAGYTAAKHAVVGLARAVGQELARSGITANAVCPGFTETPMLEESIANIVEKTGRTREDAAAALSAGNPQGRFVAPGEVADAVLWLAGAGASAITAQAVPVAGGEI